MKKFLLMALVSIMFFAGFISMGQAKKTVVKVEITEIQKCQQQIRALRQKRDNVVLQINIEILKVQAVLDYLKGLQKEEEKK